MAQNNDNLDLVIFISHANVAIDPKIPVPEWHLSEKGILRHEAFNKHEIVNRVASIYCSEEQKAIDGAEILSAHVKLAFQTIEALGEMDRSATGYLKEEEFQETANRFFAHPEVSIRGWEKAVDAQDRIVAVTKNLIDQEQKKGHIAIISHGGVGALLLCHLLGQDISREFDQPANGGGNYFCFERQTLKLKHGWMDISIGFEDL